MTDTPAQQRFDLDAVADRLAKADGNLRSMRVIMLEMATHVEEAELDLKALVLHLKGTELVSGSEP